MKGSRVWVIVLGALVFLCGFASGYLFGPSVTGALGYGQKGCGRTHFLDVLSTEIGLDEAQRQAVSGILERSHDRRQEILEPLKPALERVHEEAQREIKALLRPEQVEAFDRFVLRCESRQKTATKPERR